MPFIGGIMKVLDLLNKKYGLLTVTKRVKNSKSNHAQWLCRCECGKQRIVVSNELNRGRAKNCSFLRHKRTRKMQRGYILVYKPEHPNAPKDGWIREHVLMMSEKIGRPLNNHEEVHHKNGIKDDNVDENFELWTQKHPKGQRVEDMIDFCTNYLREYKPEILVI